MIAVPRRSPSWRETEFAVLDFETTGLDPARDHIVSFGLVPVVHARIRLADARYELVRPPIVVPTSAIRVHGLRPMDLEAASDLGTHVGELIAALEGRTLVAHAAWIELAVLERGDALGGRRPRRRAVDVLALAATLTNRGDPRRPASARLAALAETYGIPVERTHDAFADALTTAQLFILLATELEGRGDATVRDLARAGRSEIARTFFADTP